MNEALMLVGGGIALVLVLLLALSINDGVTDICATENATLKYDGDNWACSYTHYAEGYYFNQTNPITISIDATNTTYNVTGFTQGDTKGLTFVQNGVTVTKAGLYRFAGSVSFTGGNGGEYGFGMAINGKPLQDCGMGMTANASIINNVALTCIKGLAIGDHLNMVIRDANTPAQDINIYRMNLNIVEIS